MSKGRPVLYELLKEQPRYQNRHVAGRSTGDAAPHQAADPPGEGAPGIGRVMRVPVGSLFVVVAVVIVIGAIAYMFGFMRGQDGTQPSVIDDYMASRENERIGSQLDEPGGGEGETPGGGSAGDLGSDRSTSGNGSVSDPATQSWRPILSDPRESGKSYFRLVQTIRRNAVEVAEFCRANGLEAYAVPVNNSDLYYVYVLPGFTSAEEGGPKVRRLRDTIEDVRVQWRAKTGRDDLSGYISVVNR